MNIKVDLSSFISSKKRLAIVYVNPNSLKTVLDVIIHICKIFGIQNLSPEGNYSFENYSLHDGAWFIHPYQSSNVFEAVTGILRLSYDENEDQDSSPRLSSPDVLHDEALLESSAHVGKQKKKKKKSKTPPEVAELVVETGKKKEKKKEENPKEFELPVSLDNHIKKKRKKDVLEEIIADSRKHKKRKKCKDISETLEEAQNPNQMFLGIEKTHACTNLVEDAETEPSPNNEYMKPESTKEAAIYEQKTAVDMICETPLRNVNVKDQRSVPDISSTAPSCNETRKRSEEELESVGSIDLSFSSVTSVVNTTKRKRRHNRRRNMVRNKNQQIEDPAEFPPPHQSGRDHALSYVDEHATVRSHKVFSDEDEQRPERFGTLTISNITSDMDSLNKADVPIPCPGDAHISHSTPIMQTPSTGGSCVYPTPKLNGLDSSQNTYAKVLDDDKTNRKFFKHGKLDPPASPNVENPSEETLFKFRNIIALEKKHKKTPKVFYRNKNCSEAPQDGWESLPLAFGSRKSRSDYSHNESNDIDIHSFETVLFNPNDISNLSFNTPKSPKCDPSDSVSEPKVKEEKFVGARPPKRNKRYIQSIGNVLTSLKKTAANSDSEAWKPRPDFLPSSESPPPCFLIPELPSSSTPNIDEARGDSGVENTTIIFSQDQTSSSKATSNEVEPCTGDQKRDESLQKETSLSNFKEISPEVENNTQIEKQIGEISNISSKQQLQQPNGEDQAESAKPKGDQTIGYETYPVLPTVPKIGDIIATRIMTLDATMCPFYSDYRPAKVISVQGLKLELQFLDSVATGPSMTFGTQGAYTTLDWRDLVLPRLMFP